MSQVVISPEGGTNITIVTQAPRPITIQRPGVQGATGAQGVQGDAGWSPVLANVEDGERRVQQIADWTGGEGTPPEAGSYIGPSGLVTDIGDATDIRGAPGVGDMLASVYDPQAIEADAFDRANHTGTQTLATISDAGTMAAEAAADYTKTADMAAVATTGAYADLTGAPSLATVATSGAYSDLTGAPSLATVATTGTYNDLTGKPTLGGAAALNVGTTAGTVAAGDHTHSGATTSAAGFMSAADKTKLDGVGAGARVVSIVNGAGIEVDNTDPSNPIISVGGEANQPLVIVCTGQSNCDIFRSYSYTPAPNVQVWNWRGIYNVPPQGDTDVGTGFIPLENNVISWGRSLANEVGLANPDREVLLVNVGWSGMDISHWLSGTSYPDVYHALKINVEAALAARGLTKADLFAIWQGESDALNANGVWSGQFELVMQRLRAETWFPYSTPVIISGFSPYDAPAGVPTAIQRFEDQLRFAALNDPELRTYVSYVHTPTTFWEAGDSYRHANAEGYRQCGIICHRAFLSGANAGKNAGHRAVVTKRELESRVSTTVAANDRELFAWLLPDRTYRIRFDIIGFSGGGGITWGINGPTANAIIREYRQVMVALSSSAAESNVFAAAAYPSGVALAGSGYFRIQCEILLRDCDANAVLQFAWAQNSSNASGTFVNEGSRIEIEEVPRVV